MKWMYQQPDEDIIKTLMAKCRVTERQASLLYYRGLTDPDKADKYLNADLSDLFNPHLLKDLDKGVDIIVNAIKREDKITIFGDYDADGITATDVGVKGLNYLGADVDFYLPHRVDEGYGMNSDAISKLEENGTKLIITVDNGIASVNEIKLAKELGMSVIVTDHHNCPDILPCADAIINPRQKDCKYPNKNLCGCAVIWRVIEVLFDKLNANIDYVYELLSLVAIGTVADMMDLNDENRIIVREGLAAINASTNPGVTALMNLYDISELKSENIGFTVGPCLNADGRLNDAKKAVELLLTDDVNKAQEIAKYLHDVNEERKILTANCTERAMDYIRDNHLENSQVMVVFDKTIPEGIVGLVASRIKEKFQVPTFVFTEGEEYYKASARNIEGHPMSLFDAIQKIRHLWVKGGGHSGACGVSIIKDIKILHEFTNEMNKIANDLLDGKSFEPSLQIDGYIDEPDEELCREIEILEPTGKGNPKAVFATSTMEVIEAKPRGDGSHISFLFNGKRRAIGFYKTSQYQGLNSPVNLKLVYTPTINVWNKKNFDGSTIIQRSVQMNITDMQAVDYRSTDLLISSFKKVASKQ